MGRNRVKNEKNLDSLSPRLWTTREVWLIIGFVFSIKCLLVRCYHSTDFEAIASVVMVSELSNSVEWIQSRSTLKRRLELGLICLLLCNPGLILLDNIHFQYNSMLYGLLFLSLTCLARGQLLIAAALFSALLNFKHIYLYYVPAFVCFYLRTYLLPLDRAFIGRCVKLGTALAVDYQQYNKFYHDYFLFNAHAYWAPNFWSLYNLIDFVLYKIISISQKLFKPKCTSLFLTCPLKQPIYTQGLVLEYEHSVLPNINPTVTLALTLISTLPVIAAIFWKPHKDIFRNFLTAITLSAYSFFLFGWHVHEKASLMILLPMSLLIFKDLRFLDSFVPLCLGSLVSLLPLFFTPMEDVVKWVLTTGYFLVVVLVLFYIFGFIPRNIFNMGGGKWILMALISTDLYNIFVHQMVFGAEGAAFLPLMITSVICACAVCLSYCQFLYALFGEELHMRRAMRLCLLKEEVYSADQAVLLPYPYIPEFLAVREAQPMADIVNAHRDKHPPIDVLFVDGNGRYHSRFSGLATHVGYRAQCKTIGVSKNFNGFPLHALGYSKADVDDIEKDLLRTLKSAKGGPILVDLRITEPMLLSALKTRDSSNMAFISAGYGVDLQCATAIAAKCFSNYTANPIRLSDLRSRALLQKWFS
ncbi:ALG6, ALG8 glycosyltransferase family domain-containing protein [Ditylenchus destructor]|nr:ALG6, ALG8 glycosyltransferase family domain-containing protein [Ditylenchus destructor]